MIIYPKLLQGDYDYVHEVERFLLELVAKGTKGQVAEITEGPDNRYDGTIFYPETWNTVRIEIKVSSSSKVFIEERRLIQQSPAKWTDSGINTTQADYYLMLYGNVANYTPYVRTSGNMVLAKPSAMKEAILIQDSHGWPYTRGVVGKGSQEKSGAWLYPHMVKGRITLPFGIPMTECPVNGGGFDFDSLNIKAA